VYRIRFEKKVVKYGADSNGKQEEWETQTELTTASTVALASVLRGIANELDPSGKVMR
jgi:hypothetical protein